MSAAMGIETDGSSPQAAAPQRRFQIVDVMILVAATAMGWGGMLAISRAAKRSPYDWFGVLVGQEPWHDLLADSGKITVLALLTMPLVGMVTLALLPIRLLGTRPRFRRPARQPGLMASCAAGLAMALIGLQMVGMLLAAVAFADDDVSWEEIAAISAWLLEEEMVTHVTWCGGFAVLVSWTILVIGRQWRVERSWVDRIGRFIGVCWILAAFSVACGDAVIEADFERYARLHPEERLPAASDIVPQ